VKKDLLICFAAFVEKLLNLHIMIIKSKDKVNEIKCALFEQLKEENAFWSYDSNSVSLDNMCDEQLIALTLRYLDLEEIKQLFSIYSYKKIKDAWKKILVPEGEYLYTLNRFFAWYYFRAKNPDAYLKSLQTRHLNALLK
jgi:hypothetical protein